MRSGAQAASWGTLPLARRNAGKAHLLRTPATSLSRQPAGLTSIELVFFGSIQPLSLPSCSANVAKFLQDRPQMPTDFRKEVSVDCELCLC